MSRPHPRRRAVRRSAIAVAVVALLASGATSAQAATTTHWAEWGPLNGGSREYSGSVSVAEKPELSATYTSDSRSGTGTGLIGGASTWLSQGTPIGQKYGTSRGEQYLNLRPNVDSPSVPSTTTYTFNAPTPVSGWAFALGDIDADELTVSARGVDGQPVATSALGFRGGFNYCAPGVAGKPSCTGDASDVPSWDAATGTLTGNAAAADTSGSAAWFEPSVPLTSLTFTFAARSGLPVYQTWFTAWQRDVSGTVVDTADGPVAGVAVTLTDENGASVETTTTDDSGAFSFSSVLATSGYTVSIQLPDGKVSLDETSKPADLSTTDATVAFGISDAPEFGAIAGVVADTDGEPVGDAVVSVDGPGADDVDVTTESDGTFGLAELLPGDYELSLTPPDGYTVEGEPTITVTVEPGETTPATFALAAAVAPSPTPTPTPSVTPTASPAPAPPAANPPSTLPATGGSDASGALWLGGGLLLVGAVALGAVRVRRGSRAGSVHHDA